ncbi:hypothetical protein GLO73106DRAFT_00014230 [Gloeocapsa sp. PCC 73106]|nr:hypothetical protein GLO73106DRAFT_00014230 [Gloeocapsa sp. PCC 73106]
MQVIFILLLTLGLNWIFFTLFTSIPVAVFKLVAQAFWIVLGTVALLFLTWSFKD